MANESKSFRVPQDVSTAAVAGAVEAFLASSKGMQTQSSETADGYVIQGSQDKDGWKTITGMRLAITVQMVRVGEVLTVTAGQGQWSDKLGAGALGWFIAWPLAVTAGVGAYKQKKLPEEIFQVVEQFIMSGGRTAVISSAGAERKEGMIFCPVCHAQCHMGAKFCESCGAPLESNCKSCGAPLSPGAKFCPECGQPVQ